MNNKKIAKAGLGYTIGNYLLKGLSFFTIPIFARLLSEEDYGIVNSFSSYESILYVIIGMAIHSSLKNARYKYGTVAEGKQHGEDYDTYMSNAVLFICLSTVVWFIIVAFFGKTISKLINFEVGLIYLLVLNSFATAIVVTYNSHTSLNYEYKKFLEVSFFNAIGNIIMSLALIHYYSDKRYLGRIIGTVIPISIASICIVISQFRRRKPHNTFKMLDWGLKYSLPIVPHGISQIILSSFDRIMIREMISAGSSGIYSFAYNIFTIVQVTASSIDTIWNPWFYSKRREEDYGAIRKYSNIYIVFLGAFCVLVMLVAPELIVILGSAKYSKSIYCVIPIVAGGFFTMLYNIPASVEYYHEKTTYIATATTIAAILNVCLNYYFIKKYGYVAAAYTTLVTYFLYFIFHFVVAKKIEGKSIFDGKIIVFTSSMICIGAVVALLLIKIMIVRWGIAIFVGIIFLCYEEKMLGVGKEFINKKLIK